jgi:hypothetical protein
VVCFRRVGVCVSGRCNYRRLNILICGERCGSTIDGL